MQSDIKIELAGRRRDVQYDVQRTEYTERAKRGFSRHNAAIFGCYSGFLLFNKRGPGAIYLCCLIGGLSVADLLFVHMDVQKKTRKILDVGYIFLLLTMLLFGKNYYGDELSETVLICSAVTTCVLGINTYTYMMTLLAAILINEIFCVPCFLGNRWMAVADDVLLCAFLAGIASIFENLRRDIWRREVEQKDLSITDPLTHLYNRRYAEKYYENELDKNKSHAVLFGDLDNFKQVNDMFGHNYGDEILLETANWLKQIFGKAGIVARLGGDEFLAIIEFKDVGALVEMVKSFLDGYPKLIKEEVRVSVSMGIALLSAGSKKTYREICREADAAMYKAKRLGKGKAFLSANCFTEEIEINKEEKENKIEGTYGENGY